MKAILGFSICLTLTGATLVTGARRPPVPPADTPERSGVSHAAAAETHAAEAAAVSYDEVQRVLDAKCVSCHSGPEAARGLRLDSWPALTAGSDHGEAIIAFDARRSLLVELTTKLVGGPHPAEVGAITEQHIGQAGREHAIARARAPSRPTSV